MLCFIFKNRSFHGRHLDEEKGKNEEDNSVDAFMHFTVELIN